MKSDKIINLYNKNLKKASKHYNNLLEDFELEEIHDFRVQIKKLRALVRLVNAEVMKKKRLKINKEIKTFYRTAGRIRNVQLQKERIIEWSRTLSFDVPATYLNVLNEEETGDRNRARREAKEISFPHCRKTFIKSLPQELSTASIQYFTIKKSNELLALISLSEFGDETLHDIRKISKDILYDWDYINPYLAFVLPEYFLHRENIESLANQLGDFHDLCVALAFLAPGYIDQVTSGTENDNLAATKKRLEWEKYSSKEQIIVLFGIIKNQMWVENTIKNVCETF